MEDLLERQTCFGVQNRVKTLLAQLTPQQLRERQASRGVATVDELEHALVQEMYLLERTQLELAPRHQLEVLARRLKLDHWPAHPTELAWLIVLTIVRDHVPHHIHPHTRRLVLNRHLES